MGLTKEEKDKRDLFDFMQTFDDDELPNGAWQAMLEGAVELYNNENGTKFDPNNMFIEYTQRKSSERV